MVFAEAQAMGLPVASFATGGIPEAVAHRETGLLASERDIGALARNITMLLSNPSMWQRFSEAGRRRACELFDIRRQTAVLEDLYRAVLNRNLIPASA
jgi:glycosyltransferase involved in cell wall biosynthesis